MGGGCIFDSCDIFLECTPTSRAVSLALVMYACRGRYKTWTLDSGLEYGLDYGLNFGLDFVLDFRW